MPLSDEAIGTLAVVASVLGAALLPVLTYELKAGLHPVTFSLATLVPALLACIVWRAVTGRELGLVARGPHVVYFMLIGILGFVVPLTLIAWLADTGVPGTTISVLLLTEIVYTLVLGPVVLNEHIGSKNVGAALLVVAGAYLAIASEPVRLAGIWPVALLVPLSWQFAHLTYRTRLSGYEPFDVLYARLFYSTAFLFIASIVIVPPGTRIPPLDPTIMMRLVVTGVFCHFMSLSFWYVALSKINLTKATTMIMTYPAVSFVLFTLTGTPATMSQWAGLVLATTGAMAAGLIPSEHHSEPIGPTLVAGEDKNA